MKNELYIFGMLLVALNAVNGQVSASPKAAVDDSGITSDEGAEYREKLRAALLEAKNTYPDAKGRYLSGLPEKAEFLVSVMLKEPDAKPRQAYIRVTGIDSKSGVVTGQVSRSPDGRTDIKLGQEISVLESGIFDWAITSPSAPTEGNRTGKLRNEREMLTSSAVAKRASEEPIEIPLSPASAKAASGKWQFVITKIGGKNVLSFPSGEPPPDIRKKAQEFADDFSDRLKLREGEKTSIELELRPQK